MATKISSKARPRAIPLPAGLSRDDVLYYICEALEGSAEWALRDPTMVALVDEMMASKDIRATLIKHIPDAEWEEAFRLISSKAPHHPSYTPPAQAAALKPSRAEEQALTTREYLVKLLSNMPYSSVMAFTYPRLADTDERVLAVMVRNLEIISERLRLCVEERNAAQEELRDYARIVDGFGLLCKRAGLLMREG